MRPREAEDAYVYADVLKGSSWISAPGAIRFCGPVPRFRGACTASSHARPRRAGNGQSTRAGASRAAARIEELADGRVDGITDGREDERVDQRADRRRRAYPTNMHAFERILERGVRERAKSAPRHATRAARAQA